MNKARSIERNLLSLGAALGLLLVVLMLALFGVERALGATLDRLARATMPAQREIAGLRYAVSRLFERQVHVLSARSQRELEAVEQRGPIERELARSRQALGSALPAIVGRADARREDALLVARTHDVLECDASLVDSVQSRLSFEAEFGARTLAVEAGLESLIREARAVAGVAHLEYVLELRKVARGAAADKLIRGDARAQQEAAEEVVIAVLQLGQLAGRIAIAQSQDELTSIVANELAQNLSRARAGLRTLTATLDAGDATFVRARTIRADFEALAAEINATRDGRSLVELRRSTLREVAQASELRKKMLASVVALSRQLADVEGIVARETKDATRRAERVAWTVRLVPLVALFVAVAVGLHSARRLAQSVRWLRAQNRELAGLSRDLKNMNEGLEGLVAERSAALVARERSMRLVLDAMSEGLIAVDLDGELVGESSKAAICWFGAAGARTPVWQYLFPHDDQARASFQVGYAQLAADFLPFEAAADCMPQRFERDGRIFALAYRQVREEAKFERVLLVVRDITERVVVEERERDAREQHQLLSHLLKDKQGFLVFVRDSERLISELRAEPGLERGFALLHTLKGNTGVFGMESFARRCHELEEKLAERNESMTALEGRELAEFWRSRLGRIEALLTSDANLEINERDFAELVHGLRQRRDYGELIELVESFKWTQSSLLLGRFAAQAYRVAERLGKNIEVRIEHNDLRLMPGMLEDFWSSFIHVVRNAVDHGVESADERFARGKAAAGRLVFRTRALPEGGLAVELADDGRGVDFDRVRDVCEERGLPARSRDELLDALCSNGFTTRTQATDISGRGVGLGAVVAACRAAGGRVELESHTGRGSCFRFFFPGRAVHVREGAPPRTPNGTERITPSFSSGPA